MSRQEQDALVTFINSFKLTRRVTTFVQLSDGKALLELMSLIDAVHFKNPVIRNAGPPVVTSASENWVLKMNTLKRLHRLLLSYPLPPPRPSSLANSTLLEPNFSAIARSPSSADGSASLIQICRMCLAVSVWGPGNEKVIKKIQGLEEGVMAELMRSIEEVMAALPEGSPKDLDLLSGKMPVAPESSASSSTIQIARGDSNPGIQSSHDGLIDHVAELTVSLEATKAERDDALAALALSQSERSATAVRNNQNTSNELDAVRMELARVEEALATAESEIETQSKTVADMTKVVEELELQVAEDLKLRDQLDEYRHIEEKLQKSENVIEKYKKKLEESAGLRRELRNMEQENAALIDANSTLETELRNSGASKVLLAKYESQIARLEKGSEQQKNQILALHTQFQSKESAGAGGDDRTGTRHLSTEDANVPNNQLSAAKGDSDEALRDTRVTLDDELGGAEEDSAYPGESRTELKLRIKALERELSAQSTSYSPLKTPVPVVSAEGDRAVVPVLDSKVHETNDGELKELQATLSTQGLPVETIQEIIGIYTRNAALENETRDLAQRLDQLALSGPEGHEADIPSDADNRVKQLQDQLKVAQDTLSALERSYRLESDLMLSAWHDLSSRTVHNHLAAASIAQLAKRSGRERPTPAGWLGRQRKYTEDAAYSRT